MGAAVAEETQQSWRTDETELEPTSPAPNAAQEPLEHAGLSILRRGLAFAFFLVFTIAVSLGFVDADPSFAYLSACLAAASVSCILTVLALVL